MSLQNVDWYYFKCVLQIKPVRRPSGNVQWTRSTKLKSPPLALPPKTQRLVCDMCSNVYTKRKDLFFHQLEKNHLGSTCHLCDQRFHNGWVLRRHIDCKHGNISYSCCMCDFIFGSKALLRVHEVREHNFIQCKKCQATIPNPELFSLHIMSHLGS